MPQQEMAYEVVDTKIGGNGSVCVAEYIATRWQGVAVPDLRTTGKDQSVGRYVIAKLLSIGASHLERGGDLFTYRNDDVLPSLRFANH